MLKSIDVKYWEMIHPESRKRTQASICGKCDICGGSRSNPKEQKLYIYTKNGDKSFVRCHHGKCEWSGTFTSYLRSFHPSYYNMYKSENQERSFVDLANMFNSGSNLNKPIYDDLDIPNLTSSEIPEIPEINTQKVQPVIDLELYDLDQYFIPIEDSVEGYNYISSRQIPINPEWMYSEIDLQIGNILYKTSGNIVIPLKYNNKWYGFYSRNIKKKEFITFIPIHNAGYKVWNWFNIDKTKPVYIFESIFDAIASGKTNIIATLGGSLNLLRLNELQYKVFCYDNDNAGLELMYKELIKDASSSAVILSDDYKYVKDYNTFTQKHSKTLEQVSKIIDSNTYNNFDALVRINMKLEKIKTKG